jgi:arylformamidase
VTETPAIDPDRERAYLGGQARPDWPQRLARFAAASAEVLARPEVVRDLAYGPHPRQRFDFVPVDGEARAVAIFLHAGYWQARDRTGFAFLADAFAACGCDTVLANYPLAPDASVAEITAAVRDLFPAVAARERARRGRVPPILATGHSAGAHLAVELAIGEPSGEAPPIAAVLGLSGVYDLAPLVATSLNAKLGLTAANARAASPLHRVGPRGCPALFAVGGGETAAFLDQNRRMAAAWTAAGHPSEWLEVGADDHFSLLDRLGETDGPLAAGLAALVAGITAARD